MFKKASQLKLRFQTSRGPLSVEQLWDLPMNELASCIRAVRKNIKKASNEDDEELSFLEGTTKASTEDEIRFKVLKEIYTDKKTDIENAQKESERRINNQKILDLIARKKDAELEGKSIEELEALLK